MTPVVLSTKMNRYWIYQALGWIGMFLVEMFNYGMAVSWNYNWTLVSYFLAYPVFGILTSHWMRAILRRRNVFVKSMPRVALTAVVSLAIWTLVLSVLVQIPDIVFDYQTFVKSNNIFTQSLNVVNLLRYTIVWVTIYFLYKTLQRAAMLEVKNLEIDNLKKDTELKLLRTQLNPHFLFNALNSVKALVIVDPAKAREGIVKLSEILRFSLASSDLGMVSIEEELEMVEQYFEVEKLRFGGRLNYFLDVVTDQPNQSIPVGVLLTLAENAVKHGVSRWNGNSEVTMLVKCNTDELLIEATNSGRLEKSDATNGLGLVFVQKRLGTIYRDVVLTLNENNDRVTVRVEAVK